MQIGRSRTGTKTDQKQITKITFSVACILPVARLLLEMGNFEKKLPFRVACNLPVARLLLTIVEKKKGGDSFRVAVILPVTRLLFEMLHFPKAAGDRRKKGSRPLGNHLRRGKPLIGKCVVSGFQHEPLNHRTPKELVGYFKLIGTFQKALPQAFVSEKV